MRAPSHGRCRAPARGAAAALPAARRGAGCAAAAPASAPAAARRGAAAGVGAAAGAVAPIAEASSPSSEQHGDRRVDLHALRAFGHEDLAERAFVDRLEFHRRLVGLDLGEDVAGLDLVAFLLVPLGELALGHGRRQRRHQDLDRHGAPRLA